MTRGLPLVLALALGGCAEDPYGDGDPERRRAHPGLAALTDTGFPTGDTAGPAPGDTSVPSDSGGGGIDTDPGDSGGPGGGIGDSGLGGNSGLFGDSGLGGNSGLFGDS